MVLTDGSVLPDGVWPVMLTPFQTDGSIDFEAYRALIRFYIDNGVSGLFACCGSSEPEKLTRQEKLDLIRAAVETSAGRVPVVGGAILSAGLDEQIEFIIDVHQAGVHAVILPTNQFVLPEDEAPAWRERLEYILSRTGSIPLGTYEYPIAWKRIISRDEFLWMARTGRFLFHKDTTCDVPSMRHKVQAASGSALKIFTAHCPNLLAALRAGVNGYSGTGANFRPELYSFLCRNFRRDPKCSEILQEFLARLERRADECRNYPANAKAFLNLLGVRMTSVCRYPRDPVTQTHLEKLRRMVSDSQTICEQAGLHVHS